MWRIMFFLCITLKPSANPCNGKNLAHQGKKKSTVEQSKFKTVMIIIFDNQGCFWNCKSDILQRSFDHSLWTSSKKKLKSFMYPSLRRCIVNQDFLDKRGIPVLGAATLISWPCSSWLFCCLKSRLHWRVLRLWTVWRNKRWIWWRPFQKNDLQHCFKQWKIHMERCRDRGAVYDVGKISNVKKVTYIFRLNSVHITSVCDVITQSDKLTIL